MKRILYLMGFVTAMLLSNPASAQDKYIFNHFALGAEVGTTGWGFEAAMPATRYVTLRTGFTLMPVFKYSDRVKYTSHGNKEKVKVEGSLHMGDWKLLADIYPSKSNSFHFTAGFYLGMTHLIKAKNIEDFQGLDPGEGLEIGDMIVRPDDEGVAHVNMKVNAFKPYVGIGFGRPVSKHRVNFACDMGVQFWGRPTVNAWSPDEQKWVRVRTNDVNDDDFNKALDKIEKIRVWPVLNLRVYYNIF